MATWIARWELVEHLGLSWTEQVVSRAVTGLDIPEGAPLCVRDDSGRVRPAQRVGDHLFYVADLPAHVHRRFDLEVGQADSEMHHTGDHVDAIGGTMRVTRLHRWAERPIREAAFDFRLLSQPREIAPVTWRRDVLYVRDCEAVLIRDRVAGDHDAADSRAGAV